MTPFFITQYTCRFTFLPTGFSYCLATNHTMIQFILPTSNDVEILMEVGEGDPNFKLQTQPKMSCFPGEFVCCRRIFSLAAPCAFRAAPTRFIRRNLVRIHFSSSLTYNYFKIEWILIGFMDETR